MMLIRMMEDLPEAKGLMIIKKWEGFLPYRAMMGDYKNGWSHNRNGTYGCTGMKLEGETR